jgi:hypothetical protein
MRRPPAEVCRLRKFAIGLCSANYGRSTMPSGGHSSVRSAGQRPRSRSSSHRPTPPLAHSHITLVANGRFGEDRMLSAGPLRWPVALCMAKTGTFAYADRRPQCLRMLAGPRAELIAIHRHAYAWPDII